MKKHLLLFAIPAMVFGVFMIVFGGMDDSPGAQLLGLVAVIAGVMGVINSRKRTAK